MRTRKVDVAIVGAGTAGMSARQQVERAGGSYVLVDEGPFGTTCARDGCMPSKLLIAAAEAAHCMNRAPAFGVQPGSWRVNGPAVMERVRRMRDRYVRGVLEVVERLDPGRVLRGRARFVGPTTLEVEGEARVEARAIVLAPGASPVIPPPLRDLRARLRTHEDIFELDTIPPRIAVIGAGPIGLELGQAFGRLGSRACVIDVADRLLLFDDERVERRARQILSEEMVLRMGAKVLGAREREDGAEITYQDSAGNERTEVFDVVLSAAGREPNLARLDLEASGLELDDDGIPVHDPHTLQCGDAPVFLAGDANQRHPVLHEAADDGRAAGRNAASFPETTPRTDRTPMHLVFTDPQIAAVGARRSELDPETTAACQVDWSDQGRAQVMAEDRGLCRIYASKGEGTLLGAEMIGPRAEHLAHLLAWTIQRGSAVHEVLGMPFYHPVLEEGLRTALVGLASQLDLHEPPRENDLDCGPGT